MEKFKYLRYIATCVITALLTFMIACSGPDMSDPKEVAVDFTQKLFSGNYDEAFELMYVPEGSEDDFSVALPKLKRAAQGVQK